MKNILVVGAGSIGQRHIESIGKLKYSFNIHVVDLIDSHLTIAKSLFFGNIKKFKNKNFFSYKKLPKINNEIDVVIIATTVDVRKEILNKLLKINKVKYLILEKMAFDNIKDFKKALSITKQKKIPTYVNFTRRLNSFYLNLKNHLKKQKNIYFSVVGNNWGLASNSFHNLDLFIFLTGCKKIKNISSKIDKKFYKTARKNFIDVKGHFTFSNEFGDIIYMEDFRNPNSPKNSMYGGGIKIETELNTYIIYESFEKVVVIDNKYNANLKIKKIYLEKQSELTFKIIKNIFNKKPIKLPSLEESFISHKAILLNLDNYLKFLSKRKISKFKIT